MGQKLGELGRGGGAEADSSHLLCPPLYPDCRVFKITLEFVNFLKPNLAHRNTNHS